MNGPPEKKPLKLPGLRKGITFAFGDYDRDGKPQWLIHDGARNKFFIIGWAEYELLERWYMVDPDAIVEDVNEKTTLHVDVSDIENLLKFLAHNYLIKQSGYQIYQRAKDQQLFKKDNWYHWLINYYLFFRIPLLHPDKLLDRTKAVGNFIFDRYTAMVMTFLGLLALFQLSTQWDRFTHTFPTIFSLDGLFFYFIAYSICKFCHELGHAYMCKRYGIKVPTLGVAFLVFWPVLYTDTTYSWVLNSRQRMRIALAGMWVETYVTIFAALMWCNFDNITVQAICYVTITVNWMASVLINISPFMRFDGYYVLADFLKMPNMQLRAFALTRWQIRRWLYDWPEAPPEKFTPRMHKFLVAYSLITWIYRLSVYFGIALLVYHFTIKIVGIMLFAVEIFYFILAPFVHEAKFLYEWRSKLEMNHRTKVTITVFSILFLILFLPINASMKLPGTMSYFHKFLVTPEEGILQTALPPKGSLVKANMTIATITSPDLNHELTKILLEYKLKVSQARRAAIDPKEEQQLGVILSDINKEQAKYQKLMVIYNKFNLSVPFDGTIAEVQHELAPGTVLMKDQWLADVVNPNIVEGEAFISQFDFNNIKVGMRGHFYPHDLSEPIIPVRIISVEVLNSNRLNCRYAGEITQNKGESVMVETPCYNSTLLGGEIPTLQTDEGDFIPVNSVFRVLFIAQKPTKLYRVERGTLVVKTPATSYVSRFAYKLKTIIVQQSGF
jgi:putative peptide zinc metalloprotease protein